MRSEISLALAFATVMALATTTFAQTSGLAGSAWRPVEIGGIEVAADAGVILRFAAEGRVQGEGGCNGFAGSYEIDGAAIGFGPLAATRKMCPRPIMDVETRFFDALAQATRFQRDEAALELTGKGGEIVVRLVQTDAD